MKPANPARAAIKMLNAAHTALEVARDCLAEVGRPGDAAECVDIAARIGRLKKRLGRR